MSRDDIRKLLGGYATGTLSESERKALFDAALHDQQLFDALADEEVLRQLLANRSSRAELLRALEPAAPVSWLRRPIAWASAGSLLAAAALIFLMLQPSARIPEPQVAVLRDQRRVEQQQSATQPPPVAPAEPTRETRKRTPAPRSAPAISKTEVTAGAAGTLPKTVAQVVNVAPAEPMSAVSMFQQTAPGPSADASEVRAEKARPGNLGGAIRAAAAPSKPVQLSSPAIRYEVQQRADSGLYSRVDPDLPLRGSAPIRLELETNRSGYLYAFETQAGGGYQQLSVGPTVDPHVKHTVELGEPAADRRILIFFSDRPEPAFAVGAATEGAVRVLDRMRAAYRPPPRQKSANSVYVSGPNAPEFLIEIALPGR